MNYEQKYNEALERAKGAHNSAKSDKENGVTDKITEYTIQLTETIFPELKVSDNERIRKELIDFVKSHLAGFPQCEKYIAWIERQGDANKEYWRGYREGKKEILDKYAELEKQGEQKSIDAVEPRFHEGDWVVWDNKISCLVDNIYQGKESLMYTIIDTNNMLRTYSVKGFDNNAHLWTIGDAKDGDVLATDTFIFIFKSIDNDNGVHYYCHCCQWAISDHDTTNQFYVAAYQTIMGSVDNGISHYSPATKGQRDLLFAKMKEAGYEWNAETKELKQIEQTTEIPFGAKDSELQEATYHIPDGYHAEINGNEVSIKKGKQKTTWKPTEEQIEALEHLLETIRRHEYSYFHEEKFLLLHSLLEQLKEL